MYGPPEPIGVFKYDLPRSIDDLLIEKQKSQCTLMGGELGEIMKLAAVSQVLEVPVTFFVRM